MPNADFFTRFGLLTIRDFFDVEWRAQLVSEMQAATRVAATVKEKDDTFVVDESVRRTKIAQLSAPTIERVTAQLMELKPRLEQHFGVLLDGCQKPQFLIYKPGDFYQAHHDVVQGRRVSVVIFLNAQTDQPQAGSFSGGALTFYGLMKGSGGSGVGLPLLSEPGLLIAFRSENIHSVAPVTTGERYTVVSWYYSHEPLNSQRKEVITNDH